MLSSQLRRSLSSLFSKRPTSSSPLLSSIPSSLRRLSSPMGETTPEPEQQQQQQSKSKSAKPKSKPSSNLSHPKDEAYLSSVIQKRIEFFEKIKEEQIEERKRIGGELIKITLPDGAVKEGEKWITTPMDVARQIAKSLASEALISQVDDVLWDMFRPLEGDCKLKFFKFDTDEGRDTLWHSSAHILGQSLEMEYGCKLCIGPCTTRGEAGMFPKF